MQERIEITIADGQEFGPLPIQGLLPDAATHHAAFAEQLSHITQAQIKPTALTTKKNIINLFDGENNLNKLELNIALGNILPSSLLLHHGGQITTLQHPFGTMILNHETSVNIEQAEISHGILQMKWSAQIIEEDDEKLK